MKETASKLVVQLNDEQMAASRCAEFGFAVHENYMCIMWGEVVLWDSEGLHREDVNFGDEEGHDPTLETVRRVLEQHATNAILIGQMIERLEKANA